MNAIELSSFFKMALRITLTNDTTTLAINVIINFLKEFY